MTVDLLQLGELQDKAWRVVQADEQVEDELRAFGAAMDQRFEAEGIRAMLRAGNRPGRSWRRQSRPSSA